MKSIRTMSVDDRIYREFQLYALLIGKSVSSLIEAYMKETLTLKNQKIK